MKIFRNIFGDSTRIKEHRCPRCKAKIWFNSDDEFEESMKKPFLTCPICFAPYKINLDEKKEIVAVERLEQQVKIPILVTHPNGDEWIVYELSIPDHEFKLLKNAIELIKGCMDLFKTRALLDAIPRFGYYYGMGDPMSGIELGTYVPPPSFDVPYDDVLENAQFQAFSIIYRIYHIYPFQVRHMISRYGVEKILEYISTICPKCNSIIPDERVDNCPFCKKEEKTEEKPEAQP